MRNLTQLLDEKKKGNQLIRLLHETREKNKVNFWVSRVREEGSEPHAQGRRNRKTKKKKKKTL